MKIQARKKIFCFIVLIFCFPFILSQIKSSYSEDECNSESNKTKMSDSDNNKNSFRNAVDIGSKKRQFIPSQSTYPTISGISSPNGKYTTMPAYQPEVYALLCGVEDYPGSENDLSYCVDDAEDIAYLLQNTFHVPEQHITTLYNSESTESAILTQISSIAGKMDDNDLFFMSYSGHGVPTYSNEVISYSIDSPHPYQNNYDHYWYIENAEAVYMRVHFSRIETESGYDGVFVGDGHQTQYYYDLLTGDYYNEWSYWVPTNKLYIELYTDYSNTDYGFHVDKYEIMSTTAPYGLYPYSYSDSDMLTGNELDAQLDYIGGRQIVFLDSCYSGGVGEAMQNTNRTTLCACSTNEYSLEDPSAYNGVFTYAFLSAWTSSSDINGNSQISVEEVFDVCYDRSVARSSIMGYTQHPVFFDGIPGETYLIPYFQVANYENNGNDFTVSGTRYGPGPIIAEVNLYDFSSGIISNHVLSTESIVSSEGAFVDKTLSLEPSVEISDYDFATFSLKNEYYGLGSVVADVISPDLPSDFDQSSLEQFSSTLPDFDEDGLSDILEELYQYDIASPDSDGDGISDGEEDLDQDGIPNAEEFSLHLILDKADTDEDGVNDGDEVYTFHSNPFLNDSDSDGLSDGTEVNLLGSDPTSNDTDGDSLADWDEVNTYYTNILSNDTDSDGLSDYSEIFVFETNPSNADTDSDGYTDSTEILKGTDPNSWFGNPRNFILLGVLGAASFCVVGWMTVGKSVVKRSKAKKERARKIYEKESILSKTHDLRDDFPLKIRIYHLKKVFHLDDPSLFFNQKISHKYPIQIQNSLPNYARMAITKWNWKSHLGILRDNKLGLYDPFLVVQAFFSATFIQELRWVEEQHFPFSIANMRGMIGYLRQWKEKNEETESLDLNGFSDVFKSAFTKEYTKIYASLISFAQSMPEYEKIQENLNVRWKDKNYKGILTYIFAKVERDTINPHIAQFQAWLAKKPIISPEVKEILPKKYQNCTTIGELMSSILNEEPVMSLQYCKHYVEKAPERLEIQKSKDRTRMIALLKENIALDPLNQSDWLDLATIYQEIETENSYAGGPPTETIIDPKTSSEDNNGESRQLANEIADKPSHLTSDFDPKRTPIALFCCVLALAINPYSPLVWRLLLPPPPKLNIVPPNASNSGPSRPLWSQPARNNYSNRVGYNANPTFSRPNPSFGPNSRIYTPDWLRPGISSPKLANLTATLFLNKLRAYAYLPEYLQVQNAFRDTAQQLLIDMPKFDARLTPMMVASHIDYYSRLLIARIPELIDEAQRNANFRRF